MNKISISNDNFLNVFIELGLEKIIRIDYVGNSMCLIYVEKFKDIDEISNKINKNKKKLIENIKDYINKKNPELNLDNYIWYLNNIYSIEDVLMAHLVQEKKQEIINKIKMNIPLNFQPEYVFSHSFEGKDPAGYYILYKDKVQLKLINKTEKEKIKDICTSILSKDQNFSKERFKLSFNHNNNPKMHGAYRED